ncbi:U3 small nucleolar RNA-associated protein 18 homolog [Polyodon spathula]|uniref:U3 small nucleolar RNA-associated protein 18 homolog n=1 Tax=Polyodon spathula TaxID=7913 RepID=UPI001B7E49B0|nr:U3 small nucleolar RNA-associated protein 18 homolog [Polyodon spathula]
MKRDEIKRMKHLETVMARGEKKDIKKHLEELVFGAEVKLLERLSAAETEGAVSGNLLDEDSSDSGVENEAPFQVQSAQKAAWEDEDDQGGGDS